MLLKVNLDKQKEKKMSLSEIDKQIEELQKQKTQMLKSQKSDAIKQVKKLINDYQITMGSIRNAIFIDFDDKGRGIQADLKGVQPKAKK